MTAALKSGAEWRERFADASMDGKEALRARKASTSTAKAALPRGVAYDKATGTLELSRAVLSRVQRMCELVLKGDSYHTIATKVGGGWTYQGVRKHVAKPDLGLRHARLSGEQPSRRSLRGQGNRRDR